jgi:low temperature requirement protein LtrA
VDPTDTAAPAQPTESAIRVSTLELFFDLVFVFTITQLTDILVHHLDGLSVARVLVMLGVIWWMYGGYAWLTNAFGVAGWAFGVGYFVVNLVHTVLFLRASASGSARAMRSLGPLNLLSALLVLVGGFLPVTYRLGVWTAAFAVQIASPYLHRMGWHRINAGHFVERHGLVVIIAIGESIVAIGAGFAGVPLGPGSILVAVLGLCVAYYLWWAYFAGDDEKAEHVLDGITDPLRKARAAIHGWGFAHYPMIVGIVVLAAGIKKVVGHAFEPLGWGPAAALAGGAAIFLLGHAWFLSILGLRGVPHRLVAAVVLVATIPLGHWLAVAELAAVPLVMATAMIIEDVPAVRRSHDTQVHTFGR